MAKQNLFTITVHKGLYEQVKLYMYPCKEVREIAKNLSTIYTDMAVEVSMFSRIRFRFHNGECVKDNFDLSVFMRRCTPEDSWDWTCAGTYSGTNGVNKKVASSIIPRALTKALIKALGRELDRADSLDMAFIVDLKAVKEQCEAILEDLKTDARMVKPPEQGKLNKKSVPELMKLLMDALVSGGYNCLLLENSLRILRQYYN